MRIARILANWRHPRATAQETLCVIAGLNDDDSVVDGQWMGYIRSENMSYPFLLEDGGSRIIYGPEDSGATNLGRKHLREGEMFTVQAWEEHEKDYVYQIGKVTILGFGDERSLLAQTPLALIPRR